MATGPTFDVTKPPATALAVSQAASPADVPAAISLVGLNGPATFVHSVSDARTANNVMRHEYRVLNDQEKLQMQSIKDKGLELHNVIDMIGSSREVALAKTKLEEAVMWAVKHLTK
jgi:hypothetical protein